MTKIANRKESKFQKDLINSLKSLFPGCIVFKTNPGYIQGFPDLIMLYKTHWAAFECKRFKNASVRPNQKHYIDILNKMSFARFVYPENKEEVLHEIQQAFRT